MNSGVSHQLHQLLLPFRMLMCLTRRAIDSCNSRRFRNAHSRASLTNSVMSMLITLMSAGLLVSVGLDSHCSSSARATNARLNAGPQEFIHTSQCGTYRTVKARFLPWLSGSPEKVVSCNLLPGVHAAGVRRQVRSPQTTHTVF